MNEPALKYDPTPIFHTLVETYWVTPKYADFNMTIFQFHSGGYAFGHPLQVGNFRFVVGLATTLNARVIAINYAKAPQYIFSSTEKSAVTDSFNVCKEIIEQENLGNSTRNRYGILGDSAGGHLSFSVGLMLAHHWHANNLTNNSTSLMINKPHFLSLLEMGFFPLQFWGQTKVDFYQ